MCIKKRSAKQQFSHSLLPLCDLVEEVHRDHASSLANLGVVGYFSNLLCTIVDA